MHGVGKNDISVDFISALTQPKLFTNSYIRTQTGQNSLFKKTVGSEEDFRYNKEEILGLPRAFGDASESVNATWAIAAILEHSRHYDAALKTISDAIGDVTDNTASSESFRTLHLLATIQSNLKDYEAAQKSITRAISRQDGISADHLRRAYITQAEIYTGLEKSDEAIESYEQARQASSSEPLRAKILRKEFDAWNKNGKAVELLKNKWTLQERLEWTTWNYDNRYGHLQDFEFSAIEANEPEFVVETYQEIISLLDNFDAGEPIRHNLAEWFFINGDDEGVRTQCLAVLDSTRNSNNGDTYRFTNEDPAWVMYCALCAMTDLIYEQFRATSDKATKAKLFEEAKGLMSRPLSRTVTLQASWQVHYIVTLARMARKLGPLHEFQDLLSKGFDATVEALMDDVAWNDEQNLDLLSKVLSCMDGLEREAQIALSARFSDLEPENESTADSDDEDNGSSSVDSDEEDEDDDPLPEDEGDLTGDSTGCAAPRCDVSWRAWKGRKIYQCVYCWVTILCESCYEKRMRYNDGVTIPPGDNFCGKNHKYLRSIDGWKGVKNGMVLIDGEEPFAFKDWLKELKEKKWPEAWERFWMG